MTKEQMLDNCNQLYSWQNVHCTKWDILQYSKILEKRTKAQDYEVGWIVALRGLHPIASQMSWMQLSTDACCIVSSVII